MDVDTLCAYGCCQIGSLLTRAQTRSILMLSNWVDMDIVKIGLYECCLTGFQGMLPKLGTMDVVKLGFYEYDQTGSVFM